MIGREFSLSTNAPSRLVHVHSFGVWCGNKFRKWIFTLDSLSEVVEGGGAVEGGRAIEGGGVFRRMR